MRRCENQQLASRINPSNRRGALSYQVIKSLLKTEFAFRFVSRALLKQPLVKCGRYIGQVVKEIGPVRVLEDIDPTGRGVEPNPMPLPLKSPARTGLVQFWQRVAKMISR